MSLELVARKIPATHRELRPHAYSMDSMDNRDDMYISAADILIDTRSVDDQLVAAAVELMVSGDLFRTTPSFATRRAQTDFDELLGSKRME